MLTRLLAGLMLAAAWTVAPASAADLTIKVGFPAGGSSDAAARAIARHIGRFLDEKPRVVVQSVPGGASLKLLRQLGRTEPADGSVVGLVSFDHTYLSVLDPDAGEVIGANLVWVGSLSEEPSVCAVHRNSGIETLDAFLSSPFKLGATSRSSQIYAQSAMLKRLLDAPYDIVTGFAGAPELVLALTRGEIAGLCGMSFYAASRNRLFEFANVIGYLGPDPDPDIVPGEYFPLESLIGDETDRAALRLVIGSKFAVAPMALPAGTPPEVVAEFRSAFMEMATDDAFIEDAARFLPTITPRSGEELEALVREAAASDPAVIARARELTR